MTNPSNFIFTYICNKLEDLNFADDLSIKLLDDLPNKNIELYSEDLILCKVYNGLTIPGIVNKTMCNPENKKSCPYFGYRHVLENPIFKDYEIVAYNKWIIYDLPIRVYHVKIQKITFLSKILGYFSN